MEVLFNLVSAGNSDCFKKYIFFSAQLVSAQGCRVHKTNFSCVVSKFIVATSASVAHFL